MAQVRHKKIDIMIRNANDLIIGKFERESTENPIITENALMQMPLPMVDHAIFIDSP